ncbi:ATP-binding cassette domain-containing protein, partial [Acinetobacter baumannii]
PTVFESHTVEDNVLMAVKADRTVFGTLFSRHSGTIMGRVDEILGVIRLGDQRTRMAAELSHGQKQWLEIGMLLAQDPKLLLVDEPAAGMTDA